MFAEALVLARQAREIELAWERWYVAQHPLNQYPEGHSWYRPMPPKPDKDRDEVRRLASVAFSSLWEQGEAFTGQDWEGEVGLWGVHPGWGPYPWLIIPVKFERPTSLAFVSAERLDDPPLPKNQGYTRKARYRIMHGVLRRLPAELLR